MHNDTDQGLFADLAVSLDKDKECENDATWNRLSELTAFSLRWYGFFKKLVVTRARNMVGIYSSTGSRIGG